MKNILELLPQNGFLNSLMNTLHQKKNASVFGFSKKEKLFTAQLFKNPIVYICGDENEQKNLEINFKNNGKKVVSIENLSADFCFHTLEFGQKTTNRLTALFDLYQKNFDVLLLSTSILCQPIVPLNIFEKCVLNLHTDDQIEIENLIKQLIQIGYTKVSSVESIGQFAVRGDVVDIFPLQSQIPFRIYFFDTQIEKISSFNLQTQYSVQNVSNLMVCPLSFKIEYDKRIENKLLKNQTENNSFNSAILSLQQQSIKASNFDFFSAFLAKENILDYIPTNSIIVFDEPKQCYEHLIKFETETNNTIEQNIKANFLLKEHKNCLFKFEEIKQRITNFTCLCYQIITTQNKFFETDKIFNAETFPLSNINGKIELLKTEINNFMAKNYLIFLACDETTIANDFYKKLTKNQVDCLIINNILNADKSKVNIIVKNCDLGAVFANDKFVIFGKEQLFTIRNNNAKFFKKVAKFSENFTLPQAGELVVHSIHGIGMCEGITQLSINNHKRDYLVISYKNNDKLYVPTEQIDLLGKYIGAEKSPALSQLGSNQFEKVKQKVKSSVKTLAIDLLKLEQERQNLKGVILAYNNELQSEFDADFPFEPTEDQLKAIHDVQTDLSSGKIMDRLIVGDVGYGKTEVAMRAAFQAVINGKQVAILCPTTILCEQHYANFKARFQRFGIEVRCLNRFRTLKEQKQIIEEVKSGKVSILCGTHRMLSKDVEYFDLALLILDEEQRFGVADKEKIKLLKKNVHVLTLSATPIPRTLHMALVGIRDISIIETPPIERLPVQTIVSEYSSVLLQNAINKELERGGQALIVYPRVETINEFASKVTALLPEGTTIAVAHGQMERNQLENIILNVFSGDVQVLIATTLIENGINLPNANTLFVVSADLLGLSQLYQLRGRVGRSDKMAWAYLTYSSESGISETSYKRLATLLEFTALGSGFKIAMRDLEIRGAGSLLGSEQHGQMEKVGYDMYCKLLDNAVQELKGLPVTEPKSVKLDVEIDANIPNYLTSDEAERMSLYSLISSIQNMQNYQQVLEQIKDTWGNLPEPVIGLCKVALLKNLCIKNNITRAIVNNNKIALISELSNVEHLQLLFKKQKVNNFKVYEKQGLATIEIIFTKYNYEQKWQKLLSLLDYSN